ncbi:unnamed protein product [Brassica oleracea]
MMKNVFSRIDLSSFVTGTTEHNVATNIVCRDKHPKLLA